MSHRMLFSSIAGAGIAVLALFAVLRLEKPPAPKPSPSLTPLASVISAGPAATTAPVVSVDASATPNATSWPALPAPAPASAVAISPLPPTSKPKPSAAPSPVPASTQLSSVTPVPVSTPTPTPAPTPKPQTYTVLMEPDRFYPATVTLRAGDTVRWVNKDIWVRWPASDPHPAHTNLPGFDPKVPLEPEETYAHTFIQTGTFSYHDHLDADILGEVIVIP